MHELRRQAPPVVVRLEARHVARLKTMREQGLLEGAHLGVLLSAIAVLTWLSVRIAWVD